MSGDLDAGAELIGKGIAKWEKAHIFTCTPYCRAMLAEVLLQDPGRLDEAAEVCDLAIDRAHQKDEHWWEPDLYRIRAEILLRQGDGDGAETKLREGIDLADRRTERMLGLRLRTRLAGLLMDRGEADEARALVVPAYEAFTEGFWFDDLVRARGLLERLGVSLPPPPDAPPSAAPAAEPPAAGEGLAGRQALIEFRLDADYDGFAQAKRTAFLLAVTSLAGVPPERARLVAVRPGSVRIVIELPREAADELLRQLGNGAAAAAVAAFVRAYAVASAAEVVPPEAAGQAAAAVAVGGVPAPPGKGPAVTSRGGGGRVDLIALRKVIAELYTLEELDVLCVDVSERLKADGRDEALPFGPEVVGGAGKVAVVRRLISFLERRGCLDYLVAAVRNGRPHAGIPGGGAGAGRSRA